MRKTAFPAIAVFARSPVAGRAKTRLIPLLGPRGAAALQAALILDTTAKVNGLAHHSTRWLFGVGGKISDFPDRHHWRREVQRGRDLGERLDSAFARLLRRHVRAVIIGTDSPLLSPRLLRLALTELKACDTVIGPCPDGGFYLVGLRLRIPGLFRSVRLGSRHAFGDTLKALLQRGLSCAVLPPVLDIDRPRDLQEFAMRMARRPELRTAAPALGRFLRTNEKMSKR
ncbi:MAG: TIGR04282 family arsenosugar biosynthesis glycosyltransferase [Acidobacteria bacterium]|nr:TIGR04282 family arsenosugar biosynthesis glycosyltransferase [Acidobacteriota bacterium]